MIPRQYRIAALPETPGILTSLLTLAPKALPVLKSAASAIGGGGTSGTVGMAPPPDLVKAVLTDLQARDQAAYDQFRSILAGSSKTAPRIEDYAAVSFGIGGGSDGMVSTEAGRRLVAEWEKRLAEYRARQVTVRTTDGQYLPGTGVGIPLPGSVFTDYSNVPNAEIPVNREPSGAGVSLGDALKNIFGDVKGTIEEVVRSGVAGASNTANAANRAATTSTVQTYAAPAVFDKTTMIVLGAAALLLVLVLFKRR